MTTIDSQTTHRIPPHILPPRRQLGLVQEVLTAIDNPMEGWPVDVYRREIYAPPRRTFPRVYICQPEALRSVLVDRVEEFPKSALSHRLLRPILGNGILTSDGAQWRWQRQAVAPAFRQSTLEAAAPVIAALSEDAVSTWVSQGRDIVEVGHAMSRLTLDLILTIMLGGREGIDPDELSKHVAVYLQKLGSPSLFEIIGVPQCLRQAFNLTAMRSVSHLQETASAMIERGRSRAKSNDVLGLLLKAQDGNPQRRMTVDEVRDNLLTFIAAGHETTALALTWALFLVASDAEAERRVVAEANQFSASGSWKTLEYTQRVIRESLRLYPPVPVITRICNREQLIGSYRVKKGETVVVPIYALHRHELWWDAPNAFIPDRFVGLSGDALRYRYMPFGAGARICIGASFALMEAAIVLATLVRRLHFTAVLPAHTVRPLLRITMRPEGGMPMRIRRRLPVASVD